MCSHQRTGYELGENLFYSSSLDSWTDAITGWHAEVSHYLYPTGSTNGKPVGHYTQVTHSNVSTKIRAENKVGLHCDLVSAAMNR